MRDERDVSLESDLSIAAPHRSEIMPDPVLCGEAVTRPKSASIPLCVIENAFRSHFRKSNNVLYSNPKWSISEGSLKILLTIREDDWLARIGSDEMGYPNEHATSALR